MNKYIKSIKLPDGTSRDIKAPYIQDLNDGAVQFWSGTKAEYDAIETKDSNTIYNVTDDTSVSDIIANTDLSNLSAIGQAVLDKKANTDLFNLTETGEKHFLNKTQLTNCILEAPNGVATYEGDTITVKAGLRYLTGNGRNADKTLKTVEHTLDNDLTFDFTGASTYNYGAVFIIDGLPRVLNISQIYYIDADPSSISITADTNNNQVWYDLRNNQVYFSRYTTTEWVLTTDIIKVAMMYTTNKTTLSALRYEAPVDLLMRTNKREISGWGMPSGTYINLTLGSTGSTYTAPANGYVFLHKIATAANQFVNIYTNIVSEEKSSASSTNLKVWLPVYKGQTYTVGYSAAGDTKYFIFVYAEGETN